MKRGDPRHPSLWLALGAGLIALVLPAAAYAADFSILQPVPCEVIQRHGFDPEHAQFHNPGGPKLGYADVSVEARFSGVRDGTSAEYRIVPLVRAYGTGCGWTAFPAPAHDGEWKAAIPVPAGGWYRLELRCASGGAEETASLEPFGVGEVFLVAGQSHASGSNQELLKIEDPQGRVVYYDHVRRSWRIANDPLPNAGAIRGVDKGGNAWPALGNILLPLVRAPIGFVNVAIGGSASREWLPGQPYYDRLAEVGKRIGSFRAVLWQQAESDVIEKTPTALYVDRITLIRGSAVKAWGFSPPWMLAKSTLHPTVYNFPEREEQIRYAIDVLRRQPGFYPGPDTDILGGDNQGVMGTRRHWTGYGQRRAAQLWFACIWQLLNDPAYSGN